MTRDSLPVAADAGLLARLRDLALVELETLLAHAEGRARAALLGAYVDDLEHALGEARRRMRELSKITEGAEGLALLEMSSERRARDANEFVLPITARRLREQSEACRLLMQLGEAVGRVLPRLVEADRRRAALATE